VVSTDYIIIKVQDPAAASYTGGIEGLEATKPLRGSSNPNSPARKPTPAPRSGHASYHSWMKFNARKAKVVRDLKCRSTVSR